MGGNPSGRGQTLLLADWLRDQISACTSAQSTDTGVQDSKALYTDEAAGAPRSPRARTGHMRTAGATWAPHLPTSASQQTLASWQGLLPQECESMGLGSWAEEIVGDHPDQGRKALGVLGGGYGLLVHQVAMHCFERGALMAGVWNMYTALMDAEVQSLEEHLKVLPYVTQPVPFQCRFMSHTLYSHCCFML